MSNFCTRKFKYKIVFLNSKNTFFCCYSILKNPLNIFEFFLKFILFILLNLLKYFHILF